MASSEEKTSFNHFEGGDAKLHTVCKDLIKLYNCLKVGKPLNTQGKWSTLRGKVILSSPGMGMLLHEADSHIEHASIALN